MKTNITLSITINVADQLYCIQQGKDGSVITKYATFLGYVNADGDIVLLAKVNAYHMISHSNGTVTGPIADPDVIYPSSTIISSGAQYMILPTVEEYQIDAPPCECRIDDRCCPVIFLG